MAAATLSATGGGAVGSTARLGKSASAASVLQGRKDGVSMQSLMRFLFPSTLENPDSTGRLELFAQYGPGDEQGFLRGGPCGAHAHSDLEVAQMCKENCREALFEAFAPRPRSAVEAVVGMLFPVAMSQRYTEQEVRRILRSVPTNDQGRMNFAEMQKAILASQRLRLSTLIKRAEGGKPIAPPKERPPRVLFQSKSAGTLMAVTRKAKVNMQEEQMRDTKLLNSYACLAAPLEHQNQALLVRANTILVRGPGSVDDRWDRYCAVRRTGRSSYVGAKNWDNHRDHPRLDERFNPSMDDALANKYPGTSSLLCASAGGSSAAAQLSS